MTMQTPTPARPAARPPQPAAPAEEPFDPLLRVRKGKIAQPLRLFVYGQAGVGKSSLAACAPAPLVLGTEDGTNHLDVHRVSYETWPEVLRFVAWFATERAGAYQTLVVDTMDWLEPKIAQYVCARDNGTPGHGGKRNRTLIIDGKPSLDAYGFGEGTKVVAAEWREFIRLLDVARKRRGVHVVLLAHAHVGKEKNPGGDDYGIIEPAIAKPAVGLFTAWCDAMLYMATKKYVLEEGQKNGSVKTKGKAVTDGEVFLFTREEQAWRAKNRLGLPSELATSAEDPGWRTIHEAHVATYGDPETYTATLRAQIDALLDKIGDDSLRATVRQYVASRNATPDVLAESLTRLELRVATAALST